MPDIYSTLHTSGPGLFLGSCLFPSSGPLLLVTWGKVLGKGGEGGLVPSLLLQPQFLVRAHMPELQERAFLSVPVPLITVFRICMANFDSILFLLHGCDKLFYIFKHKCSISYCNICIVLVVFFCRFLFLLTQYAWLFPCSGF